MANWSDPLSWPTSAVPVAGEVVVITSSMSITLDTSTPALSSVEVYGLLNVSQGAIVEMTSNLLVIRDGGEFSIGTSSAPFSGTANFYFSGFPSVITIDSEDSSKGNDGLSRAIMVMPGGKLRIHAQTPSILKSRIRDHITVSSNPYHIKLVETVDWKAGDQIALSKTDFYDVGNTEILTLASDASSTASGSEITTVEAIQTNRWGVLQYVTSSGLSLVSSLYIPPDPNTPTYLDQRATVMHLTRKVNIQSVSDSYWTTSGFGVHTMVMGVSSTYVLDGVGFNRCGQRHFKGRYPIHWHMLSWGSYGTSSSGQFKGQVIRENHRATRCAILNSENRAIVLHGTHGLQVDHNNVYNTKGHAIFLEDGVEEYCHVSGNSVMRIRDPGSGFRIKLHDANPAGIWNSNPNNKINHNIISDSQGIGFWNAFAVSALGSSREAPVTPVFIVIDECDFNISHSNNSHGMATDLPPANEAGNTSPSITYLSRYDAPQEFRFFISGSEIWKNRDFGYRNRVMEAQYVNWVVADNEGYDFAGVANQGAINSGPLCIAKSLNNATPHNRTWRHAFASYHFEMDFQNCVLVDYVLSGYTPQLFPWNGSQLVYGGALNTGDLYTEVVYSQMASSFGWRLINSHPGWLPLAPQLDGFPLDIGPGDRNWTLAVSIHDPYGYWGPSGCWLTPSGDLYTYGLSSVSATTVSTNWICTNQRIPGVDKIGVFVSGGTNSNVPNDGRYQGIIWSRLNDSFSAIATHEIGPASNSAYFNDMKGFSLGAPGSKFTFELPLNPVSSVSSIKLQLGHFTVSSDYVFIGIPWYSNYVPSAYVYEGPYDTRILLSLTSGTSIADITNNTSGNSYYWDRDNNIVWLYRRGSTRYYSGVPVNPATPYHMNDVGGQSSVRDVLAVSQIGYDEYVPPDPGPATDVYIMLPISYMKLVC